MVPRSSTATLRVAVPATSVKAVGLLGALSPLLAFIVVRMAMYGLAKAAVSQTG